MSVCCSDSLQQTILRKNILFISGMLKKELESTPKTNILPYLNFTSAIKLLWGPFYVVSDVWRNGFDCLVNYLGKYNF